METVFTMQKTFTLRFKDLIRDKVPYIYLKSHYYFKKVDMKCKDPIEFDPYFHAPKYVGFYVLINRTFITDKYYLFDNPSLEDEFELRDGKYYSIKDYRLIDKY